MNQDSVRLTRTYQFELRGFHALHLLSEPIHGHHCQLRIGLTPLGEKEEARFLTFVKENILEAFDRRNWADTIQGEPSGENVILEIGRRLAGFSGIELKEIQLQETKKNLFTLKYET